MSSNLTTNKQTFIAQKRALAQRVSIELSPSLLPYLFFFRWYWVWMQVLAFTRQALYHLSLASSHFCSGYFGDKVLLFVQASLYQEPPILCFLLWQGWQIYTTMPSFHPWNRVSQTFWPELACNGDPPDLSLPISLEWHMCEQVSIEMRSQELLGLFSNCDPPDLSLPSS
jgi:hypothetical protein